jgi:pilus assembly protein CpaF
MGLFSKNTPADKATAPPPEPVATATKTIDVRKPKAPPKPAAKEEPKPQAEAPPAPTPEKKLSPAELERQQKYNDLKVIVHRKLVEQLDMNKLQKEADGETREKIRQICIALFEEEDPMLNAAERKRLSDEIIAETFGLGPLEQLLSDPKISDILINGPKQVYIEKGGKLQVSDVTFKDNEHLLHVIDKIVSPLGRRCDEVSPMVDARLKDGSTC